MAEPQRPSMLEALRQGWARRMRYPTTPPINIQGLPEWPPAQNPNAPTARRTTLQDIQDWLQSVDRNEQPAFRTTSPDPMMPAWPADGRGTGPGVPPQGMQVAEYSVDVPGPSVASATPAGGLAELDRSKPKPFKPKEIIQTAPQQPQKDPKLEAMKGIASAASLASMAGGGQTSTPVTQGANGAPMMGGYELSPSAPQAGATPGAMPASAGGGMSGGLASLLAQQQPTTPAAAPPQAGVIPASATQPAAGGATPAAAPGTVDPVKALYDRFAQLPQGRKPLTPEEAEAKRGEDMRTAIALSLLEFGAGAAKGDYAGGLARGGQTGLLGWRKMRNEADADQDKATQQQYANEVGLAQLAVNTENNAANREQNALYRQAMLGDRADQRRQQEEYRQAQLAQQRELKEQQLAQQQWYQQAMIGERGADRTSREGIAETRADATSAPKGKSVGEYFSEFFEQNQGNYINPKTEDQLWELARRAKAADDGVAPPTAAGGSPYRGDSPPVANAQRAPDGNWYVKGQDGRWQQILQR